ncbi:TetR/AcrR family transcriptional regulator C-terminal domain-containing protein [Escherichia coli]|uniref:TetR/AcrR family transcriptional regulator C-terminal domain-containing protein n=1 Tax=Escherichia coli TaxID=562 RepID=UPI003D80A7F9
MLAENHTHSVPEPTTTGAHSDRECPQLQAALLAYRDGARIHAGTRPGHADGNGRRAARSSARRFFAGDAVNALMTISYFTVGPCLRSRPRHR